jgi:MoaA/NifB/PqqE/SkfB family radical SAM enzyme
MRCLSVHLTDLCNSKCSFCVVGSPLFVEDGIKFSDVVRFVNANAGQYDVVNIHGGEATAHPRFLELLNLIKDAGFGEVHLQTNGIRLAQYEFAKTVVDLGVSLFIISLHGSTPEQQDNLTGTRGGFSRTVAGIENVKRAGKRLRTNTVITRSNLPSLPDIVSFACTLGVDHVNISNLHPAGSGFFSFEKNCPSMEETRQFLFEAINVVERAGKRVTLEGFPFCVVSERLDVHLNSEYRDIKMLFRGQVISDYDSFMNYSCRTYGPPCAECRVKHECGGVYKEYVDFRGWSEFTALGEVTIGSQ